MQPLREKNKPKQNLFTNLIANLSNLKEDQPSTCGSKTSKASNNTSVIRN